MATTNAAMAPAGGGEVDTAPPPLHGARSMEKPPKTPELSTNFDSTVQRHPTDGYRFPPELHTVI